MIERNRCKQFNDRSFRGAIIAENAATMYILFLLVFFPMLDLTGIGVQAFFLWYTCNQSAMAGAKGTQWSKGYANGVSSGTSYYTSIQSAALATATNTAALFPGIKINAGYPTLTVILSAIQHSDASNNQADAATYTFTNGSGLPLSSGSTPPAVDTSQWIPILRVKIIGTVQPFITLPFFFSVPGLNAPYTMTVQSDQVIENANALST